MADNKKPTYEELLKAGVHFGHLTRKWNPKMAPYIFMERNGIHLIDLNKTQALLDQACEAAKNIARSGRKILFVATKKQAREVVGDEAKRLNMPYVVERWQGGMLTNFATIKKSLRKMHSLEKMVTEEGFSSLTKKERLMKGREKDKLERVLGGIDDMNRLPAAMFIVDITKEHIAVKEAHRIGIPIIAMTDTNSDPKLVNHPIPSNDDAYKSVALIIKTIGAAIEEGLEERKQAREEKRTQQVAKAEEEGNQEVLAQAGDDESADEKE